MDEEKKKPMDWVAEYSKVIKKMDLDFSKIHEASFEDLIKHYDLLNSHETEKIAKHVGVQNKEHLESIVRDFFVNEVGGQYTNLQHIKEEDVRKDKARKLTQHMLEASYLKYHLNAGKSKEEAEKLLATAKSDPGHWNQLMRSIFRDAEGGIEGYVNSLTKYLTNSAADVINHREMSHDIFRTFFSRFSTYMHPHETYHKAIKDEVISKRRYEPLKKHVSEQFKGAEIKSTESDEILEAYNSGLKEGFDTWDTLHPLHSNNFFKNQDENYLLSKRDYIAKLEKPKKN